MAASDAVRSSLGNRMGGEAERVAKAFHESYERLAPEFSYRTREASAVPWEEVPDNNKRLMVAVAADLIAQNVISYMPNN